MKIFDIGKINSTAIVSDQAILGKGITIGANSIIYENVTICDNSIIGPNCILGEPIADYYSNSPYDNPKLVIGSNSLIRSGSIIYAGSEIGEKFECGHNVTIRENTSIGHHCRIGTLSDVQGYCQIKNYVRLHSNVHIGQHSKIGNYVWIFPYSILTNDPYPPSNYVLGVTVNDFAVLATKVLVLPGVTIGKDAFIGAMSLVNKDVSDESIVSGNPAERKGSIRNICDLRVKKNGKQLYPWRERFSRGMPWEKEGIEEWENRK